MQLENNIDTYIKFRVDSSTLYLDKEKAWKKLESKRIILTKKLYSVLSAVAAVLILGIIIIPYNTTKENSNLMSEFEKRQKLIEYESKISGTYIETQICYDCSGKFLTTQVKQVPENQIILNVY